MCIDECCSSLFHLESYSQNAAPTDKRPPYRLDPRSGWRWSWHWDQGSLNQTLNHLGGWRFRHRSSSSSGSSRPLWRAEVPVPGDSYSTGQKSSVERNGMEVNMYASYASFILNENLITSIQSGNKDLFLVPSCIIMLHPASSPSLTRPTIFPVHLRWCRLCETPLDPWWDRSWKILDLGAIRKTILDASWCSIWLNLGYEVPPFCCIMCHHDDTRLCCHGAGAAGAGSSTWKQPADFPALWCCDARNSQNTEYFSNNHSPTAFLSYDHGILLFATAPHGRHGNSTWLPDPLISHQEPHHILHGLTLPSTQGTRYTEYHRIMIRYYCLLLTIIAFGPTLSR